MNNTISNPKVEVPSGISLNDKDYLNSLLSCLKEMEKGLALMMTEASNELLHKKYKNMFDEISLLQRETYELMFRRGWYVLELAEPLKINNKFSTLNKEYQDLNLNNVDNNF